VSGIVALASVRLASAGIENPRSEARLLLAHALNATRDATLTVTVLTPTQQAVFEDALTRRMAREPLAYITGRKEFWSLDFAVGPGALVPRPETETLIEQAQLLYPRDAKLDIADLGTGSGAILIAALSEFPNASGTGFESSPQAYAWAARNAATHGGRAEILLADWNSAAGPYDLIFSNPPYIDTGDLAGLDSEVAKYEPRAALDGGADGLDAYRALAPLLARVLKLGGHALLEIGAGQAEAMEPLFVPHGLKILSIAPDLAGIPRCVVLENPRFGLESPF
jgi:release factor glutamine methyltransferase